MSANQRESLNFSYSCAAAFSVWIPKPPREQHNTWKQAGEELRQKHITQELWSLDSLSYTDIGSSKKNHVCGSIK